MGSRDTSRGSLLYWTTGGKMPTAEKIKQVKDLKERFERASGVFFTE